MDQLKEFFSKDWVKLVAAALAVIVPTVAPLFPNQKGTILAIWGSVLLPLLVAFGALSGGTSALNSDASKARADTLANVAPPKA